MFPKVVIGDDAVTDKAQNQRREENHPKSRSIHDLMLSALCELAQLTNASEVESQESCIHLGVNKTARVRPLLCCTETLSRKNEQEENGYANRQENRYVKSESLHVSLLRKVYIFQPRTAHLGVAQHKNTTNVDLGPNL